MLAWSISCNCTLCLLYIPKRPFHLNHVINFVFYWCISRFTPSKWLTIWLIIILKEWSTSSYVFMLFGNLLHNIWYKSKMILWFSSLKLAILAFSLPNLFGMVSGSVIFKVVRGQTEEDCVKILVVDLLYFWRYTMWKLGSFTQIGKTNISKAREIKIKFHLLHWTKYGL